MYGNNPWPFKDINGDPEGRACHMCNSMYVIPARLALSGLKLGDNDEVSANLAIIINRNGKDCGGFDPRAYWSRTRRKGIEA